MSRKVMGIVAIAMMLMAQTPVKKWYARSLDGAKYVYVWKGCSSWSTPQYWVPAGRIYQIVLPMPTGTIRTTNDGWIPWPNGATASGAITGEMRVYAVKPIGGTGLAPNVWYMTENCITGAEYR